LRRPQGLRRRQRLDDELDEEELELVLHFEGQLLDDELELDDEELLDEELELEDELELDDELQE
jgi:hypothetical protein